ncbi:Cell division protein FtsI [Peptidoglycan synthetase] [hydrothermal vent metagenome]|uniref:Cell division protein FtsI [Peptidoglycan synthetase] n=1 Tax=hydrothermal vent metagenome TaxID=652676 RepID=A0A3B0QT99_9ZZZZ
MTKKPYKKSALKSRRRPATGGKYAGAGSGRSGKGLMKFRIALVVGVVALIFSIVSFRAFQLQVVSGQLLQNRARRQYQRTVKVAPRRGVVYDRNMDELAVSMDVDSVYARPGRIEDVKAASRALAPILAVDRRAIRKRLGTDGRRQFVWLKRQVDLESAERSLISEMDGVGSVKESRRFYPNRNLAANLIGFTGLDSDGLEGVEFFYDAYLKGSAISVNAARDARGKLLVFEELDDSVQGMDVVLTIDKNLQYIAEKAIARTVKEYGAKAATAVVMDPYTGDVLAMANAPTFDPNEIGRYKPYQWRNRAVTDVFEPGSTLKAFLVAAALEEGVVVPDDIFFCENGEYDVMDRTFHDTKKHGWLTTRNIIRYSSNIGAIKIGEKLGKENLYHYLKAFGFGDKTEVDLPGEARGRLRHYDKWSGVSLNTISFGQGISTTALQLTSAMGAVANGGFLMKPRVVKELRHMGGKTVKEINPIIVRRVISEDTALMVTEILSGVTTPGGTGANAAIEGFKVAGKTGTAQKHSKEKRGYEAGKYVVSFLGFVPADKPRLVILVAIDEPEHGFSGGGTAAPAFKEIASESLSYLGVFAKGLVQAESNFDGAEPGSSSGVADSNVVVSVAELGVVPDFTGYTMRGALSMASARSIELDLVGSGKAVSQSRTEGTKLGSGARVRVVFK